MIYLERMLSKEYITLIWRLNSYWKNKGHQFWQGSLKKAMENDFKIVSNQYNLSEIN